MLGKLFETLYLKVFVNIVVGKSKSSVYIELCKDNRVINSDQELFSTTTINEEMKEFIHTYIDESPYYYISVLDTSDAQGAIPICGKAEHAKFFDDTASKYMCHDKKWTYYTAKSDLTEIQNSYGNIGVDFIFSPFVLLNSFFKDKIQTHTAMFILIEENYLSLAVFENSQLLFAEHLDMQNYHEDELLLDDENGDLDLNEEMTEIDSLENLETLDDFADIEDLDAIEDLDEFSDSKDLEEELSIESEEDFPVQDSEGFNEDYQRFLLIQSAINNFYKDEKYKSAFIETTYIADSVGVSGDLKRYLEEEMFLTAYVRHIDLSAELCDIAKREVE